MVHDCRSVKREKVADEPDSPAIESTSISTCPQDSDVPIAVPQVASSKFISVTHYHD
jgi:hypothetical protein